MTNDNSNSQQSSLNKGEILKIANIQPNPTGIEIVFSEGTRIRFNLMIGHQAEVITGETQFDVKLTDYLEYLVGVDTNT